MTVMETKRNITINQTHYKIEGITITKTILKIAGEESVITVVGYSVNGKLTATTTHSGE